MPLYDGSLRGWLDYLKSAGRLLEWAGPCDPVYELAAIAKSNDGSAVLFDLSAGAAGGGAGTRSTGRRVVANLAAGRDLLASAIGCAPGRIARALMAAAADPVPCRSVTREAAPTKARVMENPDLESLLPVPTFTPGDAGPYITGGILVSRHPVTGRLNASVHRLQVMGPDRAGILVASPDLASAFAAAEETGVPLPVAVAIGLDPLILLATQVPGPAFELEVAGALKGLPLDVVRAETVDLEIPAGAEYVLEGHLLPGVRVEEGPIAEFAGYYASPERRPVFQIQAATHREDPVYHAVVPGGLEHLLFSGLPKEAVAWKALEQAGIEVRGVNMPPSGSSRFLAYISIAKREEGQGKLAARTALQAHRDIKVAVVVDDDVDPYLSEEIEWAVATRFQPPGDLVILEGVSGSPFDPSTKSGITGKMGIDATAPLGGTQASFRRAWPPAGA